MNRRQQRKRSKYCSTLLATLCSLHLVPFKFLVRKTSSYAPRRPYGHQVWCLVAWYFGLLSMISRKSICGAKLGGFVTAGGKVKGSKSRRVQELKRARQVWRGDKMRWVLSIVSWSAIQGTEPAVGRRPSPRRCPAEMAADRERVTVLAEASGWYLSRVAKERIPARRDAAFA